MQVEKDLNFDTERDVNRAAPQTSTLLGPTMFLTLITNMWILNYQEKTQMIQSLFKNKRKKILSYAKREQARNIIHNNFEDLLIYLDVDSLS